MQYVSTHMMGLAAEHGCKDQHTPPLRTLQILVGTNILPELFEKPTPSLLFIHDLQRCQRCRRVHPVFEDAARIIKVRLRWVEAFA